MSLPSFFGRKHHYTARATLLFTWFLVFQASPLAAQDRSTGLSDSAQVFLVTVGPGNLVWERFGHNGLWIRDPERRIDRIYHWGLFSFESENFWPKFLQGYMDYSIGTAPSDSFFQYNAESDREVHLQELNLNANQKNTLFQFLLDNDSEGQRIYRYDYYLDNCSTRARDAIDAVLGGLIAKATQDRGSGQTFRAHTRRLLQGVLFPYLGIHIGLGHPADDEISVWEEMFTPMALRRHLNEIALPDGSPLVLSDNLILESKTLVEPKEVPSFLSTDLSFSGAIAALVIILGYLLAAGQGWARVPLAFIGTLWGFLSGCIGTILLLIWFFTEHRFGHWNENLFQFNPLSLLSAFYFFIFLFRKRLPARALPVFYTVAGFSAAGFALQLVPGFNQVNGEVIALALPVHLAWVWALRVSAGVEAKGSEAG